MRDEFVGLLEGYLQGSVDLEAINSWLARHIWAAKGKDADLLYDVSGELFCIMDGTSDEDKFVESIGEMIRPTVKAVINEGAADTWLVTTSTTNGPSKLKTLEYRESPVDLRWVVAL